MQSQAQRLIPLFRTIVLSGVTAVLIPSAVLPMSAQNSVPATASQAARMQQFASRLHPTGRPASQSNPTRARRGSPQGGIIYDNGPINGTVEAWTINFGFVVSDSFTAGQATNVNGMTFGAWLFPGDVLESVEISITSQPNGGTTYFDQTVSFNGSNCFGNQLGYNVCTETSNSFSGPQLQAGTYWVNLQNATVNTGDPVSWDENNGPSQAYDSSVGTIPSESFTLLGDNGSPQCFASQGKLQVLYNFTQQQAGTHSVAGVTMDRAGNLYGTTENGGNNGAGFAYKLGRFAGWLLDPLFSFSGGNNGGQPTGVVVASNGSLYGGAQGGIQNCGTDGSQYCGLVFNLRPQPTACPTTQCNWNEKVPYRFSSESDGSGTINVSASDQAGNLYGTTSTGGASDQGTVFELTPSGGSWTKTTLYSFTGGHDGYGPTQVLLGNDGNLYGIANGGVFHDGVVFQLTPSGGEWTLLVLRAFGSDGFFAPASLVQDSAGNLYGIAALYGYYGSAAIFVLEKTSLGRRFSFYLVDHSEFDVLNNLVGDAAGNLYGTGYDYTTIDGSRRNPNPGGGQQTHDSYIFKASYDSNGWHYEDLEFLGSQFLDSSGSLALDSSGNLYGTTYDCGTSSQGTVWQLSP